MAKWEERCDFLFVVIAIADKDALAIADLAILTGIVEVSRIILQADGERGGQFTRWICIAKQNISKRVALFLAIVPKLQHGWHFVDPGHFHWRAGVLYDNGVLVGFCDALDEFILRAGQFHIDAVEAF